MANRKDALEIIENLRAFGISDTQIVDTLFGDIFNSGQATSYVNDLAEEFNIKLEDVDDLEDDFDEYDEFESENMPFGY